LDADTENHTCECNPLIDYGPFGRRLVTLAIGAKDHKLFYAGKTKGGGHNIHCGCLHAAHGAQEGESYETGELSCSVEYTARGPVTLDKFIVYTRENNVNALLEDAAREGFGGQLRRHAACAAHFWENADLEITGSDADCQGARFNLFHLMQAAGRDGQTGMPAKGLTGEGYEGHCFWDTEVYAMPVFTHTMPELSRALLDFRYNTLPAARRRARQLGHPQGALYPWRTIDGEECSAYFPLGTAQYHINADIAFALLQYVKVTGELDYLKEKGAEILCETARVWADAGCFSPARGGRYCICSVTGPDEYTALVDNNFYTNFLARENLRGAVLTLRWLSLTDPAAHGALAGKIGLSPDEPALWEEIANNMYLPFDEGEGVYLQDDGFLMRQEADAGRIPPERRHLLYENYHPLFVWRQRLCKQADTLLAMTLYPELFDARTLERHYDYYSRVTLHHSTLSSCVFGTAAAAIGRGKDAYRYFHECARLDLDDITGNVSSGIHAAGMAGAWHIAVFGFAGLQTGLRSLRLSPKLPARWSGYSFRITYRQTRLRVTVNREKCTVRHMGGPPAELSLSGKVFYLASEGDEVSCCCENTM
jgi:alpha,alpha-trehalose phosphorylase